MNIDAIDKALLNLLQNDCKLTTKQLSLELNLSSTAVFERIEKLERSGLIEKYVALVNKKLIDKNFVVFCHLKLLQHSKEQIAGFEKAVQQLSEVTECHHVSGDYDYILKVMVKDMESYRLFLVNKLTTLPYIGSTHSVFMIAEVKNATILLS